MEHNQSSVDQIKCPNCGETFPISQAIYHQIAEKTRDELKAESIRQQKIFAARDKELIVVLRDDVVLLLAVFKPFLDRSGRLII